MAPFIRCMCTEFVYVIQSFSAGTQSTITSALNFHLLKSTQPRADRIHATRASYGQALVRVTSLLYYVSESTGSVNTEHRPCLDVTNGQKNMIYSYSRIFWVEYVIMHSCIFIHLTLWIMTYSTVTVQKVLHYMSFRPFACVTSCALNTTQSSLRALVTAASCHTAKSINEKPPAVKSCINDRWPAPEVVLPRATSWRPVMV